MYFSAASEVAETLRTIKVSMFKHQCVKHSLLCFHWPKAADCGCKVISRNLFDKMRFYLSKFMHIVLQNKKTQL